MIESAIFLLLWYFSGLFCMAWSVKFNRQKIFGQFGLYLAGSLFGPIIAGLIILDGFIGQD
jgi:hypothetical protein